MDYKMAAYALITLLLGLGIFLVCGVKGWKAVKDESLSNAKRSKELVGHGLISLIAVVFLGCGVAFFWLSHPSNQVKPDAMSLFKAEQEKAQKAK
jgi:cytochrome bd-type quinol oxidase subunit 1